MASAVHLMANAVHPVRLLKYTPVLFLMLDDGLCSTLDCKCSKHQVKLLMYMMAYSVHLLAYTGHLVRLLIYMIGYADHLMANVAHRSGPPKVHPSVVPNVRGWPLQYTWWQIQYTQVRLLKYTPVLFLMLHDGLCSTLDGKCSTPKWGSWSAPQYCSWC